MNKSEREIEFSDLTIADKSYAGAALRKLGKELAPYHGWKIFCDLRETTSLPMVKKLIQLGWINPTQAPIPTHTLSGERMHHFEGVLNIPSRFGKV